MNKLFFFLFVFPIVIYSRSCNDYKDLTVTFETYTINALNYQLGSTSNQVVIGENSILNITGYSNNKKFIKDGSKIRIITSQKGVDVDSSVADFCSTFTVICLLNNNGEEDYSISNATRTQSFTNNTNYPYNFNYQQTTFISRS